LAGGFTPLREGTRHKAKGKRQKLGIRKKNKDLRITNLEGHTVAISHPGLQAGGFTPLPEVGRGFYPASRSWPGVAGFKPGVLHHQIKLYID
jgi:hypothetical protein